MEVDKEEQINKAQEKKAKSRSVIGIILFLLFGIGTWLNLNGIWIQLPLLVPRLPESWDLSPQLGLASNIANVGPLIIALIRHLSGESSAYEVPSICAIFAVGISVPIILSFTWFKRVFFLGQERSIYLLVLGFFLALVNCTSSVTYLPFVNRFDPKWLNVYFGGESLASLIPAILGLIQGVGGTPVCVPSSLNASVLQAKYSDPRFSVQLYLLCLSIIMLISFIAFILLWKTQPKLKQKHKAPAEQVIAEENARDVLLTVNNDDVIVKSEDKDKEKFSLRTNVYLLIILWTSVLLIGCLPSINSYSLNPYGAETFHYVIIACQFCYPIVSCISTLRPKLFTVSTTGIIISTLSGTLGCVYIFLTAFKSPCSPFVDEKYGGLIVGIMWILVYLVFYSERIALGNYFNETAGHRGLFWYGLLTQGGAFSGAIFIFILSSTGKVFNERDFCKKYPC